MSLSTMSHGACLIACLAALALPARASDDAGKSGSPGRLALAEAHAGEPVDYARFSRPMDGFEVLDKHALLIWEGKRRAWLVKVEARDACPGFRNELDISLERTLYGTIDARTGYVRSDRGNNYCKITQVREVDVPAWREAKRQAASR